MTGLARPSLRDVVLAVVADEDVQLDQDMRRVDLIAARVAEIRGEPAPVAAVQTVLLTLQARGLVRHRGVRGYQPTTTGSAAAAALFPPDRAGPGVTPAPRPPGPAHHQRHEEARRG